MKSGSGRSLWMMNDLVNEGCLHTVKNSSISSSGSLSLNQPVLSLAFTCIMMLISCI